MLSVIKFETKMNIKRLLIWSLAVGGMGLFCIILYKSMESSIAEIGDMFSSMGAFSAAFGMDKLSIATMKGYFATEVGTIHSLGSAMFRASLASVILSKEEDGHTSEFTYALPLSRIRIVICKYVSLIINLTVFTIICFVLYSVGFIIMKAEDMGSEFTQFMFLQLIMNIVVASVCFMISSLCRKNRPGIGIGVVLFMYFFDLMSRVIPDLEKATKITPFAISNATDIFTASEDLSGAILIGISMAVFFTVSAVFIYNRKDLAG